MAKDLPTGRVRRAAKVGKLAGGQAARGYATKAANLTRGEEGRQAAELLRASLAPEAERQTPPRMGEQPAQ